MKSASQVLDFHVDDLTPNQRARVLGAMLFYAREEADEIHKAWDRNRKEMTDAIKSLEEGNKILLDKLKLHESPQKR